MNEFIVFTIGFLAGILGSMLGLGGGFLLVPLLTIIARIPVHEAIGISLASITATSISALTSYTKKDLINFKIGSMLETFTIIGAILGAFTAFYLSENVLKILLGILLLYVSYRMFISIERGKMLLKGKYRMFLGLTGAFLAGLTSGLLGIGGGVLKMPILTLVLGMPTKMAIATSMFMMSITASSAALIYYVKEVSRTILIICSVYGAFLGAQIGSRLALKAKSLLLRKIFGVVLLTFSIILIVSGMGVNI